MKNMIQLEPGKTVRIRILESGCDLMKTGTEVILKGPVIDYENSAPMCITALTGIYPWVMAARFGIASSTLEWSAGGYRVWCPEKLVEFEISPCDDAKPCEGGCPAESKVP